MAYKSIKALIRASIAAFLITFYSLPASAIPVTYLGDNYDVSLIGPTSYSASSTLLESQVWWGDASIAIFFSDSITDQLGLMNIGTQFGPMFAHGSQIANAWDASDLRTEGWSYDTTRVWNGFAVASLVAAPEPGILGLLVGGLLGWIGLARLKSRA